MEGFGEKNLTAGLQEVLVSIDGKRYTVDYFDENNSKYATYIGGWANGQREGSGVLILHGGEGYNGVWEKSLFTSGVVKFPDGKSLMIGKNGEKNIEKHGISPQGSQNTPLAVNESSGIINSPEPVVQNPENLPKLEAFSPELPQEYLVKSSNSPDAKPLYNISAKEFTPLNFNSNSPESTSAKLPTGKEFLTNKPEYAAHLPLDYNVLNKKAPPKNLNIKNADNFSSPLFAKMEIDNKNMENPAPVPEYKKYSPLPIQEITEKIRKEYDIPPPISTEIGELPEVQATKPIMPPPSPPVHKDITFPNGDRYSGEIANGIIEGKGRYAYSGGDVYIGVFKDNKQHGEGEYQSKDGFFYKGSWKDGEMHGVGMYRTSGGATVTGEFCKGVYVGNLEACQEPVCVMEIDSKYCDAQIAKCTDIMMEKRYPNRAENSPHVVMTLPFHGMGGCGMLYKEDQNGKEIDVTIGAINSIIKNFDTLDKRSDVKDIKFDFGPCYGQDCLATPDGQRLVARMREYSKNHPEVEISMSYVGKAPASMQLYDDKGRSVAVDGSPTQCLVFKKGKCAHYPDIKQYGAQEKNVSQPSPVLGKFTAQHLPRNQASCWRDVVNNSRAQVKQGGIMVS